MTVAELIAALQEFPPATLVLVDGYQGLEQPVVREELVRPVAEIWVPSIGNGTEPAVVVGRKW